MECMIDCYSYWIAVTESTQILGLGDPRNIGFDDLSIEQYIYYEWYWDDGVLTASKIVIIHRW